MKILLAAGAAVLIVAMLLPLRVLASSPASRTHTMALAIGQPLSGIVPGSLSRFALAEPGLLFVVGFGLMTLGSLVRRFTNEDQSPADSESLRPFGPATYGSHTSEPMDRGGRWPIREGGSSRIGSPPA